MRNDKVLVILNIAIFALGMALIFIFCFPHKAAEIQGRSNVETWSETNGIWE